MSATFKQNALYTREEFNSKYKPVYLERPVTTFFTGDSVETQFTVASKHSPDLVFVAGLLQRPGTTEDYTVLGNAVTFAAAPAVVDVAILSYVRI